MVFAKEPNGWVNQYQSNVITLMVMPQTTFRLTFDLFVQIVMPRCLLPKEETVDVGGKQEGLLSTKWCYQQGSNLWPPSYQDGALPTELWQHDLLFIATST